MTSTEMTPAQMVKAFNNGAGIAQLMKSTKQDYETVTNTLRDGGCNLAPGGRGRPGAKFRKAA